MLINLKQFLDAGHLLDLSFYRPHLTEGWGWARVGKQIGHGYYCEVLAPEDRITTALTTTPGDAIICGLGILSNGAKLILTSSPWLLKANFDLTALTRAGHEIRFYPKNWKQLADAKIEEGPWITVGLDDEDEPCTEQGSEITRRFDTLVNALIHARTTIEQWEKIDTGKSRLQASA